MEQPGMEQRGVALVIGAGQGLGAALARAFSTAGLRVALAARSRQSVEALAAGLGATAFACDATRVDDVNRLFAATEASLGAPEIVVYNAGLRIRGPLPDLDPADVQRSLLANAFGGFLVGQAAARSMIARKRGSIFFTGASASIKGFARSAPFAMGKFALRGLAQSMARELGPSNIHVAHFVIDGAIAQAGREPPRGPDSLMDADAIAANYLHVHRQPRTTWSWEIDLRSWVEPF
ncbi:MAG: SDR family NAD(P)-dependent oxidoreductase [Alphaproteobacteria bacterium]